MIPPPPRSTLFPYTRLFRSQQFRRLTVFAKEIDGSKQTRLRKLFHQNGCVYHSNNRAPHRDRSPVGLKLPRSEEHTSELQSQPNLVCRLLLDKKKVPRQRPP